MKLIFSINMLLQLYLWKKAAGYMNANFWIDIDQDAKIFIKNPEGDQEAFPTVTHYPYQFFCTSGQLEELMDIILHTRKKL